MRKRLIAGNWKMNLHWNEAMSLIAELSAAEAFSDWSNVDVSIFPPFPYLRHGVEFLLNSNSSIRVGAQNCSSEENGAYTGEVSASILASLGARNVLIGHSERRTYFNENSEELLEKTKNALAAGLVPFFCCGERLEDRANQLHQACVKAQLEETVFQLDSDQFDQVVIAYEPVWAIGTGETATPEQAEEMHAFIRGLIADNFTSDQAERTRIVYGGSMKPSNAKELLDKENVDGGLIGGASLQVVDFTQIIGA